MSEHRHDESCWVPHHSAPICGEGKSAERLEAELADLKERYEFLKRARHLSELGRIEAEKALRELKAVPRPEDLRAGVPHASWCEEGPNHPGECKP